MDHSSIKAESVSAKDLARRTPLTVPQFQRPYVWDKEQWEQLWADVIEPEDHSSHFLGNVVTCRDQRNDLLLVDGQQRFTTLFVLAAVLRNELWDRGFHDDAEEIQHGFLMHRVPQKGWRPNLVLKNTRDAEWMNEYVYCRLPEAGKAEGFPMPPKRGAHGDPASVKSKNKAFHYFLGKARKLAKEDVDALVRAPYRVMSDALFVAIGLQSDADAYALFERLNSTGIQLSLADLLNNFVLANVETRQVPDPGKAKGDWQATMDVVEYEHLDDYVRRQWLSRFGKIGKRVLYKRIATSVREGTLDLQSFLHDLADEAPAFVDLTREGGRLVPGAAPLLQEMKDLNLVLGQTLLLPVWASDLPSEAKLRYLQLVDTFLVRYAPIQGLVTNRLEDHFSAWARRFREAPEVAFPEIHRQMVDLGPTDEQVWGSFLQNDFKPKTATALLRRIGLESGMDWERLQNLKALPLYKVEELREGKLACFLDHDQLLDDAEKIGTYVLVKRDEEKAFLEAKSFRGRVSFAEGAGFPPLRVLDKDTEFGHEDMERLARAYEERARQIWTFRQFSPEERELTAS